MINAIHAEGDRQAKSRPHSESSDDPQLFASRSEISFDLLKSIQYYVRDNEVAKSHYWEWEDAIYEGFDIFHKLRTEGQGTITLDLETRSISFRPTVYIGLRGQFATLGSAIVDTIPSEATPRKTLIQRAILNALAIDGQSEKDLALIEIDETSEAGVAIKTRDHVRQAMWDQGLWNFVLPFQKTPLVPCHALLSALAMRRETASSISKTKPFGWIDSISDVPLPIDWCSRPISWENRVVLLTH